MSALNVTTGPYSTRDPDRLDITRAGCDRAKARGFAAPGAILAPSNGLVFPTLRAMKAAKDGAARERVWTGYVKSYVGEMRASYRLHRLEWRLLLTRPRIVLVCFCRDSTHCHRSLAAGILARLGATNGGEITPERAVRAALLG